MRFKELLEYKRDITATNLGTQLINAIAETLGSPFGGTADKLKEIIPGIEISSRPDDDEVMWIVNELNTYVSNLLKYFEDADPSPNKQYTEWIIRRYIDGGIRYLEDVDSTVAEGLAIYHELKTRRMIPPELMDIGKVKGKDMVRFYRAVYSIYRELPDQVERAKGNAEEFYNDADIRIVVPDDKTAACYYGQGTQWCTASTKSTNYFDHYNSQGPLYIIIPKKPEHEGEKYQLHFGTDFYANENDSGVPLKKLINRWPQLHKVFYEEYTNAWNDSDDMKGTVFLATPETLDNWEDITHDEILPRIKPHLETPVSVYNWIGLARLENRYQAYIDNDNDNDDDEYTAIHEMRINALDEITEFISKNKEKSLGVIDGIILDLTELNTAMKYNDISGTISHHIYRMMPDAESSAMHKDQPRVLRDLRFRINVQIWTAISHSLNPYFEDVFDN
jgi:hypothetical protein